MESNIWPSRRTLTPSVGSCDAVLPIAPMQEREALLNLLRWLRYLMPGLQMMKILEAVQGWAFE